MFHFSFWVFFNYIEHVTIILRVSFFIIYIFEKSLLSKSTLLIIIIHNERAEWVNNITRRLEGLEEGPKAEIHMDLLKTTLKRIPNWKTPGHGGIYGFWFKKFTSIHDRLTLEMSRCLQGAHKPDWMTKGKTTLIQKDRSKGTYRQHDRR